MDFNVFYSADANEPTTEKASWVLRHLRELGSLREPSVLNVALGRRVFRADLYQQAVNRGAVSATTLTKPDEKASDSKFVHV
jgi:hypothetical protein